MKEANKTMQRLIQEFPSNLKEGLNIAEKTRLKNQYTGIQNVVICGMGGSGIGGKIVSQWISDEINIPVVLCQDYDIPTFVSNNTLVIASSYSGNTEETLISVKGGIEKGAKLIGITSGGELHQLCLKNNFDVFVVPGGNPPRTALAFSLVQLLSIFEQTGLVKSGRLAHIQSSIALLENNQVEIHEKARELAEIIGKKIPAFYGDSKYEGITIRAKQQFNENAKVLCWQHVIPEMNHNELVGWGGGNDQFVAVFLDGTDSNERNQRRFEISINRTKSKTKFTHLVKAKGENLIERSMYLNAVIDWASLYNAELNNVDSIEIEIIDYLKAELSKI
ncbi:MAG: bifunctional phosphoglucose/phosphomannose isomerase [Bacteroidetes bacterium]|nr:bifunctional phosphoglucose/phosphomannose isomerase [Bacteroidota bacterium]